MVTSPPVHDVVAVRRPFAGRALLDFLAYHLVPGVETADDGSYSRTLDLPGGPGTVTVDLADDADVRATFRLADTADLGRATEQVRWLVDADHDARLVHDALGADPVLGRLVAQRPGLRLPGQVDGAETAVRTVVGQQISVVGARTVTGRMVAAHGREFESGVPGLTHLFPDAQTLAAVDPESLPMPRARGRALVGLSAAVADGRVRLGRGVAEPSDTRRALLGLTGIGPWTADYVAMRVFAEPDAFLPTDLGVRQAITRLGHDPATVIAGSGAWSPWRSYALMHLWATLMPPTA